MTTKRSKPSHPRRFAPACLSAVLFLCIPSSSASTGAEQAPAAMVEKHRVLVIQDDATDALLGRVIAEIRAVEGLEILVRPLSVSLDADARVAHAQAAIQALPSRKGVEMWTADATTGRSLLRQSIVDENPAGPDYGLVALQAAEYLRTSLFPRQESIPAPPTPPSPAVPAKDKQESPGESALQAGLGWIYSRGGVSPSLQGWIRAEHAFTEHSAVAVEIAFPVDPGSIGNTYGDTKLLPFWAGAGLVGKVEAAHGRVILDASANAAFASIHFDGHANPGFDGAKERAVSGLVFLRTGMALRLHPMMAVGVAAMAGTTTSRIRIVFTDRPAGEWGIPVLGGQLYVGWHWR